MTKDRIHPIHVDEFKVIPTAKEFDIELFGKAFKLTQQRVVLASECDVCLNMARDRYDIILSMN
jgi:hypothetical protein